MLLSHRPCPPLARYVEKLWYCEGYPGVGSRERVLPNGRFQLIINLSVDLTRPMDCLQAEWNQLTKPVVVGMRSRFSVVHTAALQSVIGVLFWPGGALPFFGAPADEFYNESMSLDLIWGSSGGELRDRLRDAKTPAEKFRTLELALLQKLKTQFNLHPAVQYGLRELTPPMGVRGVIEVAKETGLSRRRFAQLFREQVGITPKLYCRIHRFQDVLSKIALGTPVDWARVALDAGYSDQAHLAHEFHDFSGISPSSYRAARPIFVNHVAMD